MKEDPDVKLTPEHMVALRKKAKDAMASLNTVQYAEEQDMDRAKLLEELNIYHIELEMQHDELQQARDRLEDALLYRTQLFEKAPIGYFLMDRDGIIKEVNETFSQYMGIRKDLLTGRRFQSFITQTYFMDYHQALQHLITDKIPRHVEVELTRSDSPRFWVRLDFQFMAGGENEVPPLADFILCSVLDISNEKKARDQLEAFNHQLEQQVAQRTMKLQEANAALKTEIKERKAAEKRAHQSAENQSVLLRELHHRVKNNMQIVISLLNLQSKKVADPQALSALMETQHRIRSLAILHEILYQSDNLETIPFKMYLRKIIRHLAVVYDIGNKSIRIKEVSTLTELHIDIAIPLGLIITELVINAIKHAFPGNDGGEICVTVEPDEIRASSPSSSPADSAGRYRLMVMDNGIGLGMKVVMGETPETLPENADSLGFKLIRRLVLDQLKGSLAMDGETGSRIVVTFNI